MGYSDASGLSDNWLGNTLPLNDGSEEFIFGPARGWSSVMFNSDINARKVSITGITRPFYLDDDNYSLTIGADGLLYAPAVPLTSYIGAYPVIIPVNQTWDIQSGTLWIYYDLEGAGRITKTGAGTLILDYGYNPYWAGGLNLVAGRVVIRPDYYETSLGTGPLTFSGGTLVASAYYSYDDNPVKLPNPIFSNGLIKTSNNNQLHFDGEVTLNAATTIQSRGQPLFINSRITDNGNNYKLTIDSAGAVILDTSSDFFNNYGGGTHVARGVLIFANEYSVPASGLITVDALGYAGYASTLNVQGGFLNKLDPLAVHGTIGFDSDPNNEVTNSFNNSIDLTGFAATARLGSATRAAFTSVSSITPQGADYRFGGGGGYLKVETLLTGAYNVVGDSPSALPLTVHIKNTANNFTGDVSATHTALVFGTDALPATANLVLHTGGYIGSEDLSNPQAFIDRFPTATSQGMIGLNGPSFTNLITANLNLGAFTGGVYLGTSQVGYTDDGIGGGLRLTGTITTGNGGTDPYRFGGYKGGLLRIESALTGTAGMHIGDPNSPATFGDIVNREISTVALMGDNSGLSGDITLFGGQLFLGHANALGTGRLIVQGMALPPAWQDEDDYQALSAPQLGSYSELTITNPITLNSSLEIAESNYINLTGKISGPGQLFLNKYAELTLGNSDNDFTGGIYLGSYSSLFLDADHAAGPGPLSFGGGNYSTIYFNTANPVLGGLIGEQYDYVYFRPKLNNTTVTIDQGFDSSFEGAFQFSDYNGGSGLRVVKTGTGTLRWQGGGLYVNYLNQGGTTESGLPGSPAVSLEIQQGRLILGEWVNFDDNNSTFWVRSGATLAVDQNYYTIYNPIVLDPGARLSGHGSISEATISSGAILSPGLAGLDEIGTLSFSHLELDPGGILEWHIQNPAGAPGDGFDHIVVSTPSTLVINATEGDPFSIKVISLNTGGTGGLLGGLLPGQSFAWTLISSLSTTGFNPAKFALDVSLFQTNLGNGLAAGDFSLALSGNNVVLNFTAVPEPSTYALMGLGLTFIGWTVWRRRRV